MHNHVPVSYNSLKMQALVLEDLMKPSQTRTCQHKWNQEYHNRSLGSTRYSVIQEMTPCYQAYKLQTSSSILLLGSTKNYIMQPRVGAGDMPRLPVTSLTKAKH